MGIHLNSANWAEQYQGAISKQYFIDKTLLLTKLFPLLNTDDKYLCITRPRRFGKSTNARMLAAYFGKHDSSAVFTNLQIAKHPEYTKHLNQHNVIFMTLDKDFETTSLTGYLNKLKRMLKADLLAAYPDCEFYDDFSLPEIFTEVQTKYPGEKFIFIIDEWDAVFDFEFMSTAADQQRYQTWLKNLLKDQPYVEFAYLTGIRPIAARTSGSGLNMFSDNTFINDRLFAPYFGFTKTEVELLYHKYLSIVKASEREVTLPGLAQWYDGYDVAKGTSIYNPRSVTEALRNNALQSYWTKTGPWDEVYQYVRHNVAGLRQDLEQLYLGHLVSAEIDCYGATSSTPMTRDEIISAMVVYGLLSAKNNQVRIPNEELWGEYRTMIKRHDNLAIKQKLEGISVRFTDALAALDAATVAQTLEDVHLNVVPQLKYNHEAEFARIIWRLLDNHPSYRLQEEQTAGLGRADFILLPTYPATDVYIIELKVNQSCDVALQQIIDKKYLDAVADFPGRIIAAGISFSTKQPNKHHSCALKVLREAS